MEKHSCKLCFKTFSNGRALGGHVRSHLINLPVAEERTNPPLDHETESAPSASLSEDGDEEDVEDEGYGHPKQSIRLVDHHREVSFFGSVVLQDRESETESSKNPTRRRSKRIRKSSSRLLINPPHEVFKKKGKFFSQAATESWAEPEPVNSSFSDVTTEEDVAFCLMMMSRDDNWKQRKQTENVFKFVDQEDEKEEEEDQEEEEEQEDTDESEELEISKLANNKSRGKYRCETCSRTFRSYQALGGHRARHRKSQGAPPPEAVASVVAAPTVRAESKVHQCPYCFRVFASGQALGGHKRSHAANYASTSSSVPEGKKVIAVNPSSSLIDLNLPATMDDDESGHVEVSAVSDAEFVIDPYRYLK